MSIRFLFIFGLSCALAGQAMATDGAYLVSSQLPSSLSCGERYTAKVTMLNTGSTTWTRDTHKLGALGDSDPFRPNHRVWLPTGVTVAPGQQYTFSFILEADQNMNAGNYLTQWQMVHEFVSWFGPIASRNVGVTCVSDAAQLVSSNLPASLSCGQTYQARVTMRNTGTATWTRDTHKLGAVDGTDPFFSGNRIKLPHGVTVEPGQTYSFSFELTASLQMNPGTYTTDWRMVHENVAWFGATASRNTSVTCIPDAAQLVTANLPGTMVCGDSFNASVTMRNTGSATWTRNTHKLGTVDDIDPFFGTTRVKLPVGVTVAPGQQYTFTFTLSAASGMTAGSYLTDWRMVHEGVSWFGEIAQKTVSVVCVPDFDNSEVLSFNLPTTMSCGDSFQANVVMRNTGTTTWTRNTHKLGRNDDNDPFYAGGRIKLPHGVSVRPGQSHTFSFILNADEAMSAGSYLTDWRMVHEGVAWFGAIADSNVTVTCQQDYDDARVLSASFPETMDCGQTSQVVITMKNSGTTTWRRSTHKLAAVGGSDPLRTNNRVWLPSGVTVPPDGVHTFVFNLSAGSSMTPGDYLSDWRMVHEGIGLFGDTASQLVSVTCAPPVINDALFISNNLPPYLNCGDFHAAAITVKNTGTTTWTRSTHMLGALNGSDPFFNGSRVRLPSGVTVAPGGQYTFTMNFNVPSDAIGSYVSDWRMILSNAGWFGDTLTKNIQVTCQTDGAQLISSVLPSTMNCGNSFQASVTMRNTGNTNWTRSTFRLGARDDSDPFYGATRVLLPSGVTIQPGQQHTFNFTLTAAADMNPRTYITDWQMVREGVAWFGPIASRNVNVSCQGPSTDSATLLNENLPSSMNAGESLEVTVTMSNTGTTTWTRASHRLGAVGDEDPLYLGTRVLLPLGVSVPPGGSHSFVFTLIAADDLPSDTYTTDWRMVHEGVGWFGDIASSNVNISNNAPLGAPVLDSIGPEEFINGRKTVITLLGQNLTGSTVSIPTEQTDPSNPVSRIFPTARLLTINSEGTRMTVEIDARDNRIIDYYTLQVDNGIDKEAIPFRVLPPGPLVDLWTPDEPERGGIYILSLVGHNLTGATISPSAGGRVRIFGVDNSREDRLNGLMEVEPGAALGPMHLIVRDPQGRSINLPITIMPEGQSSALTRNIMAQVKPVKASATPPDIGNVSLQFQEYALRMPHLTEPGDEINVLNPALAQSATARGFNFSFYITVTYNLARFHWQQALMFDPGTGEIGDRILQGLNLGDRVRIGAFVLSFYLEVNLTVYFRITNTGFSFPLFCLEIMAALEVPGWRGEAIYYNYCVGGDSVNFTSGSTTQVGFNGGDCAEVTPEGPPADGFAFAEVQVNDCCEQPISINAQGASFTGSSFSVPYFNANNSQAGLVTPGPMCTPDGCSEVRIEDPPSCIAVGKERIFTAKSPAVGGSYQWRIVNGANKASIVGSATEKDVTIRGNFHSNVADDITLEVTYTRNGHVCTDTVEFSVIEIQLEWRNSGTWSPGNSISPHAPFGEPNLGPIYPGRPPAPNAQGFHKNMEIKATIMPCDPNLRCKFDFKRISQGRGGFFGPNTNFFPDPLDCPQGGCDDDGDDNDEDLILDGSPSCSIYVVDVPGIRSIPCTREGWYILNCKNFQEWLNVDGEPATDRLRWYASTRVICVNGVMQPDPSGAAEAMGRGSINCNNHITPPPSPINLANVKVGQALRWLRSPYPEARTEGAAALIYLYEINGRVKKRGSTRDTLTKMLTSADDMGFLSQPLIAIQLIGMLHIDELAPALLDYILEDYQRVLLDDEDLTPAALALAQIGEPAVEPILEAAATASDIEWDMMARALKRMKVQAAVRTSTNAKLSSSSDVLVQERLLSLQNP